MLIKILPNKKVLKSISSLSKSVKSWWQTKKNPKKKVVKIEVLSQNTLQLNCPRKNYLLSRQE